MSREVIDDRVIAFSNVKQHWVWRLDDAAESSMTMIRTWPNQDRKVPDSLVLDDPDKDARDSPQTATNHIGHSFVVHRLRAGGRRERFSWFYCVRRHGTNREEIEGYDVRFETLLPEIPQTIGLRPGARLMGAAPTVNGIPQMYFRVGGDLLYLNDGHTPTPYQGGLPQTISSHQLAGPLVLSVGRKGNGAYFLQLDSLHHQGAHADVTVENDLPSDPLLWHRWVYTVELAQDRRLFVHRRAVKFDD
jgi:hypothetical protein